MFGHPLRPGQVSFEGALRASGLTNSIDMQHDLRNLAPIRALGVRVEQPQIGNQVQFS